MFWKFAFWNYTFWKLTFCNVMYCNKRFEIKRFEHWRFEIRRYVTLTFCDVNRFVNIRLIHLRFKTLTLCDSLFCAETFKEKDDMWQSRRVCRRSVAAPFVYIVHFSGFRKNNFFAFFLRLYNFTCPWDPPPLLWEVSTGSPDQWEMFLVGRSLDTPK